MRAKNSDVILAAFEFFRKDSPDISPYDLDYHSFPMVFGSTAGPFGGIGGQALTTFQIEVVTNGWTKESCVYANGRFWKTVDDFQFSSNLNK